MHESDQIQSMRTVGKHHMPITVKSSFASVHCYVVCVVYND